MKTEIKSVLIIGSGPIVVGQACEFDYSGTQACKVLKRHGIRVILVNNNPATIMTDPEFADATYLEPLTPYFLEEIIKKERPDALLPTLGGQTALNLAVQLHELGILERYGVKLIGSNIEAIKKAEDRELFKKSMEKIGLRVPESTFVQSIEEGFEFAERIGFPLILRPSFTLGGTGGAVAYDFDDLKKKLEKALIESPIKKVLVEQSLLGWKEYELEVMRDRKDNFIVVCSIENFHPMGIHTGDSITVAPAQTLTDKEYQRLRNYAKMIISEIGVETGGANIQFAIHPENGEVFVIEMNPRVSRSSALASKATGFPIAKIATLLALGYTLDEIQNDITKKTFASFEPSIDYCVVKIPRWDFEKFREVDDTLGVQMKSIGEVMAIGRNFKSAFQKAIRSLEIDRFGFGCDGKDEIQDFKDRTFKTKIGERLKQNKWDNIFWIRYAFMSGMSIDEVYELTKIDKWFLHNLKEIVEIENEMRGVSDIFKLTDENPSLAREVILKAKRNGFSDRQLAFIWGRTEKEIRDLRKKLNIVPVYKTVDTCAAEFESYTPYFYSSYDLENESIPTDKRKILIIGSGPNRIGQGIEFDYTNVHAVFALKEEGYETIMVNCNPETVSTDYDTADRLYFEPITFEDVMNIVELEKPDGVIISFGGQTPLKLAKVFEENGVKILGTSPESIDIAEDRGKFIGLLDKLGVNYPACGYAKTIDEAVEIADKIGFPVLVRPSYVLGGRAMKIIYSKDSLVDYLKSEIRVSWENPVLIDQFLEDAFEYDVDAICDGKRILIMGIMEHIEEAGIHSGDSSCVFPPIMTGGDTIEKIIEYTQKISLALGVVGLINIQFAEKDGEVYVLEANPRSSRTVPFISKATGIPFAKIATKLLVKDSNAVIEEFNLYNFDLKNVRVKACKAPVFSFSKFPNVNVFLGPEMRSTGEVIGLSYSFGESFAKAQIGAGNSLPTSGAVLISVNDRDKNQKVLKIANDFVNLGFKIIATDGTARFLRANGIYAEKIYKVNEGRPDIVDYIKEGRINFIINTPLGESSRFDEFAIGRSAVKYKVPFVTTLSAGLSAVEAIKKLRQGKLTIKSLQEYHSEIKFEITK